MTALRSSGRRSRLAVRIALLSGLPFVAACQAPETVSRFVERTAPGELTAPCPPEPKEPAAGVTDNELGLWIRDLRLARDTCASRHERLSDWARGGGSEK